MNQPTQFRAEIISIGSELTSGKNLDTNSQWLSVELANLGIPVSFHTTVSDNLVDNITVLKTAVDRCELVVITGGLGPTQDDLTRDAMAAAGNVRLEFHPPSFDAIQSMFARRNRAMPERNRVQAMFPVGSEPIPNLHGTAPGIWMWLDRTPPIGKVESGIQPNRPVARLARSLLVAMPGVPSEMVRMFTDQVRKRLIDTFGLKRTITHRKINAFGAGESDVESKLLDITQRGREPEVGITVHDATISLRIAAAAEVDEMAQQLIQPTAQLIYERLGQLVFGEGDEELQHVVARLLDQRGITIAAAEGCTGGIVAERLVSVPGASRWFRGGIVAYSNLAKQECLKVSSELIERHGAVSCEVAEAMAAACRQILHSDLAVATVGVAGPDDLAPDKTAGSVCIAVCSAAKNESKRLSVWGDRLAVQSRTAKHALNLVRLAILQWPPSAT